MAASSNWRRNLNDHNIFTKLRANINSFPSHIDSTNILCISDGELFVWDAYNSCILTTNLKFLVGKNESEVKSLQYQTLLCTVPPSKDIDSLVFNESGTCLALIGRECVSVLELPQKWGKHGYFEGGKDTIMCRTTPIGERMFVSGKNKVLHAAWHPASSLERHITLLTSDNIIRIFSLARPESAERTYSLDSAGGASPCKLRIQNALGEAAVGFDFAPPVKMKAKRSRPVVAAGGEADYVWPVYVLWGNGDVYTLSTALNNNIRPGSKEASLEGPLSMFPPAEDNYGTDACSIACLYTRPPTLVIATSEGKLHHCIVLAQDQSDTQSEQTSTSSLSLYEASMTSQRLYVYETVELELSLTTPPLNESADVIDDDFSCPIRLHKDPVKKDRYHCSHSAGVHTVALPWQQRFQQFCDDEYAEDLPEQSEDDQSIVEHLICTKPLPTSPASAMLGLCVCADRLLGCALMCLTSSLECVVLPLATSYKTAPPPLLSDTPLEVASPVRHVTREPFDQQVFKILQRSASNPLIKTQKTELSPQECLQLLSRATQVFREEYVQKQHLAREVIEKRVRVLREHKAHQLRDLAECEQNKNILTDKAQALAERFEDSNEAQQELIHRVETVLKKLQAKLPVLSEAEKNMQKELSSMKERLRDFSTQITVLKQKKDYQDRQRRSAQQRTSGGVAFSKTQTQQLRTSIQREGEDISEMMKQVNSLKLSIESAT